jgi:hypothetical protein
MELLLNVVWLLAAILVSAAALRHPNRLGPGSRQRWVLGVAVLCLCIVLFPAISMTDDLQQVTWGSEENSKILALADVHSKVVANVDSVLLLAVLVLFQAKLAQVGLARCAFVKKPLLEGFLVSVTSRPPPCIAS